MVPSPSFAIAHRNGFALFFWHAFFGKPFFGEPLFCQAFFLASLCFVKPHGRSGHPPDQCPYSPATVTQAEVKVFAIKPQNFVRLRRRVSGRDANRSPHKNHRLEFEWLSAPVESSATCLVITIYVALQRRVL
jgi:hypothetical protein